MAYAQKITHFYCYTCRDYEPKTSPHYRNQKRRFARRQRERETADQEHAPEQQQ